MTDRGVFDQEPEHDSGGKHYHEGTGSPRKLENQRPDTEFRGKHDPFADEDVGEVGKVRYRTMSWWHCGIVMVAETIALGILSLPSVVAALGMAPAVILIVGLGALATYTGYNLGQFKLAYPHIHSMADAGEVLFGRIGREVFGTAQLLFLVFIMGSHVLTFSIMLNTLSNHGTCSIAFNVVGLIVSFLFTIPRTLKNVSWFSIASFISVFAAMMITMVAIGIEHPGKEVDTTVDTSFYKGFLAVTNIVFAYAGHVAFFGFISEMKKPEDYPKALYLLQGLDTSLYLIAAVVIYYYGGPEVASPALGSTSLRVSQVAYGIAIPTIIIAGVINAHVATKYIYVRVWRGTGRMHERGAVAIGSWVGIAFGLWVLAWVIAEAIPVFNNLLSLITALFASWFTYGLSGVFWLFLNRGRLMSSPKKMLLTVLNVFVVAVGAALMGLGLYVSGRAIHEDGTNPPFSCADNQAPR